MLEDTWSWERECFNVKVSTNVPKFHWERFSYTVKEKEVQDQAVIRNTVMKSCHRKGQH